MPEFNELLRSIQAPPRTYAEALYRLRSLKVANETRKIIYETYLWVILRFIAAESFQKANYFMETLQSHISLEELEQRQLSKIHNFLQMKERTRIAFTPLETRLLQILAHSPQTPMALIYELYGSLSHYESGINRLKNLIFQLRKKDPKRIRWENGLISLRSLE